MFLLAFIVVAETNLIAQSDPIILQRQPPQQNQDRAKEQLARTYYQSQEFEKALELYAQLYEKNPQQ